VLVGRRGAGWAAGPVHVLPETESGHRRAAHAASYCYHGRPNPKLAPGQKAALFPRDGDVRRRRRTEKEGRRGRRAPGPHVVLVAPLARVFPSPPSLSLAGLIDLDVGRGCGGHDRPAARARDRVTRRRSCVPTRRHRRTSLLRRGAARRLPFASRGPRYLLHGVAWWRRQTARATGPARAGRVRRQDCRR